MRKLSYLTVGMLLFALTCASAEIYRCRTAAGKLVMTDNMTKLPAGCEPLEGTPGGGSFNVVPNVKEDRNEKPPEQKAKPVVRDPTPWLNDASDLVKSYNDAVRRRTYEGLEIKRRRLTQEIKDMKRHKQEMLGDVANSGLTGDQQNSIRETLDQIPQ